jgi:phosphoribosylaminoimidazolecarboxamide formyltransferase/IMP cyclohydrolase
MTPQHTRAVRRALLSVSDKNGLVDFARGLADLGVELVASGGTAGALREAGLEVVDVETLTGSPEMLGGRVKTLHPRVHGGVLARRDHEGDRADLSAHDLKAIDLVVVNLYPFEATVARPDVSLAEAVEKIDIGGPSMIRSAAKNHAYVGVVVDPADYPDVLAELRDAGGLGDVTRSRLALRAFERTARYDAAIHAWLADRERSGEDPFPAQLAVDLGRAALLRYGENPHQRAALYGGFLDVVEPLHGKELSYNNLIDVQAALALIQEFGGLDEAAVAILKHNTPCGVGLGTTPGEAWGRAYETDPESPFGGIVVSSRAFDLALARHVDERRAGAAAQEEEPTPAALPPGSHPGGGARPAPRLRRPAGAGAGRDARGCRRLPGGDATQADGAGAARPGLRLTRGQAREEQRHRVLRGRPHPRRGRRRHLAGGCDPPGPGEGHPRGARPDR